MKAEGGIRRQKGQQEGDGCQGKVCIKVPLRILRTEQMALPAKTPAAKLYYLSSIQDGTDSSKLSSDLHTYRERHTYARQHLDVKFKTTTKNKTSPTVNAPNCRIQKAETGGLLSVRGQPCLNKQETTLESPQCWPENRGLGECRRSHSGEDGWDKGRRGPAGRARYLQRRASSAPSGSRRAAGSRDRRR